MTRTKHGPVVGLCSLLLLFAPGFFCSDGLMAQNPAVVAHDAWVRMPAPSKTETAAYMVLENHGSQPRAVVSASSDAADKVEMHQMKMAKPKSDMSMDQSMGSSSADMSMNKPAGQSMMVMTPVSKIEIPANGKTTLAPNGLHLMIFGLKTRPALGDKINVTLKLDDGTTVPVVATVRQ